MSVLVLVPAEALDDDVAVAAGCSLMPWRTGDDIISALHGDFEAAVLVSDGLESEELGLVIQAVPASGKPMVEVRSGQWDGFSPMPLAAVCKGVVTGFGLAGAWAAAQALRA
jgi:hypothetical protein